MRYIGKIIGVGENLCKFRSLWLFMKVYAAKFWGRGTIGSTSEQSAQVFSVEIVFSANSQKISPSIVFSLEVPLYGRGRMCGLGPE